MSSSFEPVYASWRARAESPKPAPLFSPSLSSLFFICFFFFSSRRRHTRSDRDWSSDVCSSDLKAPARVRAPPSPWRCRSPRRSRPMSGEADSLMHRVLVIDDNAAIHEDYRKILVAADTTLMSAAEVGLFGEHAPQTGRPSFEVDSALQGRDGVERARVAVTEGRAYSVAFVDMRMPPGWDGLETVEHLWKVDPDVQVVICSAYTDYDWLELLARLGHSDKLIAVKKPFEPIEILQWASALSRKWQNARALKRHVESLGLVVTEPTQGLEAANRQLRHLASHDALTGL